MRKHASYKAKWGGVKKIAPLKLIEKNSIYFFSRRNMQRFQPENGKEMQIRREKAFQKKCENKSQHPPKSGKWLKCRKISLKSVYIFSPPPCKQASRRAIVSISATISPLQCHGEENGQWKKIQLRHPMDRWFGRKIIVGEILVSCCIWKIGGWKLDANAKLE